MARVQRAGGCLMLPRDTWLGHLTLFEVYVEHDGPRMFAVVSDSGHYFLVVSTDEDGERASWLYAPVSRPDLERVRAGEMPIAQPFRQPVGGYAFRVTTPFAADGSPTVEPVRRSDLRAAELPGSTLTLNVTTLPTVWRLEAIRGAPVHGERAHETRIVPPDDASSEVLEPGFVAGLLRTWKAFVEAIVPHAGLRVAAVAPGSLRAVFTAPKAKNERVVDAYSSLVACGLDAGRMRRETRKPAVAAAYYDLVRFLSDAHCSMEVATATDGAESALNVVRLTKDVAAAHTSALSEPQVQTEERSFLAAVLAVNVPRSSLEVEVEPGHERLAGTVTPDTRRLLHGLRIGSHYRFETAQTTRVDTPSSTPRIEIELRSRALDSGTLDDGRPLRRRRARPGTPLQWFKALSPTDALRAPSGHIRPAMPLTRSRHEIDQRTWFRHELFSELDWTPAENGRDERASAEMFVTFNGTNMGDQSFELSHDPERSRHHVDPPTRLQWNPSLRRLLLNNPSTGCFLVLRRDAAGELYLDISRTPPPPLAPPTRRRG